MKFFALCFCGSGLGEFEGRRSCGDGPDYVPQQLLSTVTCLLPLVERNEVCAQVPTVYVATCLMCEYTIYVPMYLGST
jgi:hypothetical protein